MPTWASTRSANPGGAFTVPNLFRSFLNAIMVVSSQEFAPAVAGHGQSDREHARLLLVHHALEQAVYGLHHTPRKTPIPASVATVPPHRRYAPPPRVAGRSQLHLEPSCPPGCNRCVRWRADQ